MIKNAANTNLSNSLLTVIVAQLSYDNDEIYWDFYYVSLTVKDASGLGGVFFEKQYTIHSIHL